MTMRRKARLMLVAPHMTLVVLASILMTCRAAVAETPSGDALLRQMGAAGRTLQFTGTATTTRAGQAGVSMKVWARGTQRRTEFTAPPVRRGDLIIDDGTNVWTYHRAEQEAIQTRAIPAGERGKYWERMAQAYTAKVTGSDTVAGRPAWVVTLVARSDGKTARKFWIDKATKLRLRFDRIGPGGEVQQSMAMVTVQFGAVDAGQFRWKSIPGSREKPTAGTLYTRLDRALEAASWLQYPRDVPARYGLESAIVDAATGEVWLRYTNGENRFSIFQKRAPGVADAAAREVQGGAVYWLHGGSRFLLVGLSVTAATRTAGSVR